MQESTVLFSRIEGEGFPFFILHGFLGMSDNWKTLGNTFAKDHFQVHMIDLRNHGKSFHSPNFSYQAMMEDVLQYASYHSIEKFILLGHSMGGKVAMELALSQPEKIEKLIIADISPRYYTPHHQDILQALKAVDFSIVKQRNQVDEILGTYIKDFGTRQFLMKNIYWKTPDELGFRFNLEVLYKHADIIGKAQPDDKQYQNEVLFLKGGNSNYIKEQDEKLINKIFIKAVVKTIPNAGHWLHAENPTLFYELVYDFIKK